MSIQTEAKFDDPYCAPSFRRDIIRVHDTTVHWAEAGTGRPCILLHGLSDSYRTWQWVAPALAKTRRVLMPDLQGHGLSGRPDASYSLAWHASVISGWISALGLDVFDLVGHSFGGGVAQWLLLERLKQTRRLGLIAAGGLGREVSLGLRLASLPYALELFGQPFMGIGSRIGLRAAGMVPSDEERKHLKWMNTRPGTARALARTVRDVIDWRGQCRHFLDRAHELEELPPTALYWGDRDKVIPFAHALETEALIDGATIMRFAGVGHFPHHERPAQMAAALTAFLDAEGVSRPRLRHLPAARPASNRSRTFFSWKSISNGLGMAWQLVTQGFSAAWRAVTRVCT